MIHKCYVIDTKVSPILNNPAYMELIDRISKSSLPHQNIEEVYEKLSGSKPKTERRMFMEEFSLPLKKNLFGLYLIKAEINGVEKQLLLDTGAQISSLNEKVADECGCSHTDGEMDIESFSGCSQKTGGIIVDTFRLGGLEIKYQPMTLAKKEQLSMKFLGISLTGIDGILGWDILSTLDFEIDDLNKTFNVIKVNEKISHCNLIKATFPTLIVYDQKKNYALAGFDSGAKTSWINERRIDGELTKQIDEGEALIMGVHGFETLQLKVADKVRFKLNQSNIQFEDIITGRCNIFKDLEFDAVFGNEIIRKRKIRFLNSQNFVQIV